MESAVVPNSLHLLKIIKEDILSLKSCSLKITEYLSNVSDTLKSLKNELDCVKGLENIDAQDSKCFKQMDCIFQWLIMLNSEVSFLDSIAHKIDEISNSELIDNEITNYLSSYLNDGIKDCEKDLGEDNIYISSGSPTFVSDNEKSNSKKQEINTLDGDISTEEYENYVKDTESDRDGEDDENFPSTTLVDEIVSSDSSQPIMGLSNVSNCYKGLDEIKDIIFNCSECEQCFSSHMLLIEHRKTHQDEIEFSTDKTKFKCDVCDICFDVRQQLIFHNKIHNAGEDIIKQSIDDQNLQPNEDCLKVQDQTPFPCPTCENMFVDEKTLKKHLEIHLNKKSFPFINFGKTFLSNFKLKAHTNKLYPKSEGSFKCKWCAQCFSTKNNLVVHENCHSCDIDTDGETAERPYIDLAGATDEPAKNTRHTFICEVCKKSYPDIRRLKQHIKVHSRKKTFQCAQCEKCYYNNYQLRQHSKVHTGEKPYQCPEVECGKCFHQKGLLKNHMRNIHSEQQFSCNICNKNFSSKFRLMVHTKTHQEKKTFQCATCGQFFSNIQNLNRHIKRHNGEKPHKCTVCEKRFFDQTGLKAHLRTHTGDKPYQCEECGKRFCKGSELTRHLRLHTGENLFSCPYCEKKFPLNSELKVHLRSHTGEKPFQCNHCGNSFVQSSHLKDHMTIHTGAFLECVICYKKFTRSKALKDHMKRHTGIGLRECSQCGKGFMNNNHLARHMKSVHRHQEPVQSIQQLPIENIYDVTYVPF